MFVRLVRFSVLNVSECWRSHARGNSSKNCEKTKYFPLLETTKYEQNIKTAVAYINNVLRDNYNAMQNVL